MQPYMHTKLLYPFLGYASPYNRNGPREDQPKSRLVESDDIWIRTGKKALFRRRGNLGTADREHRDEHQ
jgi:hypothetical protein